MQGLRSFVGRPWDRIAAEKTARWLRRREQVGIRGTLRDADELRRHARALNPSWPSNAERMDDIQAHAALSRLLRRVR